MSTNALQSSHANKEFPRKLRTLFVRPLIKDFVNSQSNAGFEDSVLVPPLNIFVLAAVTRDAGYETKVFDCEAADNNGSRFESFLNDFRPDVVGISMFTTNFHGALETAKIIKKLLPESLIICGGAHMSIFPEETLSYPEFDYGFAGEAELPLLEFLDGIENDNLEPDGIKGLIYRSGKGVRTNPAGFNEDITDLPFPAYELGDLDQYTLPNTNGRLVSLYLTRGCPYTCGFCFRSDNLLKMRYKSLDRVMEEITYMVENHNVRSINFVDETISLHKNYFLEFCARMAEKNWDLVWQAPTRVNCIDEDIVKAAKASGCHTFRFGLESGNAEILANIDKKIDKEQSVKALRLCKKYGIKTIGYFIVGYVNETPATMRETIDYAKALNVDYAAFFTATPMPGTRLFHECAEKGIVDKNYWRDFVLGKTKEPLNLLVPDADVWLGKAYREFYFRPRYIFAQMMTLTFWQNLKQNIVIAASMLFSSHKRVDMADRWSKDQAANILWSKSKTDAEGNKIISAAGSSNL